MALVPAEKGDTVLKVEVARPPVAPRRSGALTAAKVLLAFLGLAALGGGLTMIADPNGGLIGMPAEWMKPVPLLDNWLAPGIVLAAWFGLGSLLTLAGMTWRFEPTGARLLQRWGRGRHWTWAATVILGATQVVWIGVELLLLPQTMWIQALMATVGAVMGILMLTPGARRSLTR
jgi:hypothetical protein